VAKEIFDRHMREPNQIGRPPNPVRVTAQDLLTVPTGTITEKGLRWNIDVGIRYVESWLRGMGCVPIYNLMEDTATAEICRTQVWQWLHFNAKLDDERPITSEMVGSLVASELKKIKLLVGVENFHRGHYRRAARIFEQMMTAQELPEFLTVAAYEHLD
jgi:malate synthase